MKHKRVKPCEGQLELFVEKFFDSRQLLVRLYDFGTCQRSDGSFYGHGGVQCHKGVEATAESLLASTKTGKVSAAAGSMAESATSAQLASLGTTKEELAAATTLFDEKCQEQISRLNNGEVTPKEIESLLVNHFDHDITRSEFVFIGMENGHDRANILENSESSGQSSLARMLAQKEAVESGDMTLAQATLVNNAATMKYELEFGKTGNINSYVGAAADVASRASGNTASLSREQANIYFFGGTKVSTIEMSVPSAVSTAYGTTNKAGLPNTIKRTGDSSMDPNASMYGAMYQGQAGSANAKFTRSYVAKNFEEARTASVAAELKRGAASDKFKGGMAAPGSGAKYNTFKSGVIDNLERSGTPVYTTKTQLSTGGKIDPKTGLPGAITTKSHTLHVAELAPGKYLVAGDFSLNTTGYAANRNQAKAYQAGVKAAESYKRNGEGGGVSRYKAPAKAAPTTKAKSSSSNNKPARTQSQISKQAAKRQREVDRAQKDLETARKKRDRYRDKPNSAAYKKAAAAVNEKATSLRKLEKGQ